MEKVFVIPFPLLFPPSYSDRASKYFPYGILTRFEFESKKKVYFSPPCLEILECFMQKQEARRNKFSVKDDILLKKFLLFRACKLYSPLYEDMSGGKPETLHIIKKRRQRNKLLCKYLLLFHIISREGKIPVISEMIYNDSDLC